MATFPTSLPTTSTIPVETSVTPLSTNHVASHQGAQNEIIAIATKIGVDGSAITTTHDYKLGEVTSSDKAVGKTATQTLTNKTLTSPVINVGSDATGDIYYRNSGGLFTRLAAGTNGFILKLASGLPSWVAETTTVDASTTVKGIVEAATSAEVTAGTATGGTGAVLAVTPDALAASTPVFNGSGLTNIMKSSNGTFTISASGTTTITTSFKPYRVELHSYHTKPSHSHGGYDATSNTMWCTYVTFDTNGSVESNGMSQSYALNITYGTSGPTATTATINNITTTSFDVVKTLGTASGVVVYWTAIGY